MPPRLIAVLLGLGFLGTQGIPTKPPTFQELMSSQVTYVELAGRRNRGFNGYNHFGLVLTCSNGDFWLVHGHKGRQTITYLKYMSPKWIVLTGRPVKGVRVNRFYAASVSFEGLTNPSVAMGKMLKLPGIVISSGLWTSQTKGSLFTWAYNQSHFKTKETCTAHKINRHQYFSTSYMAVHGLHRIKLNISYIAEGCKGVMQTGCNGYIKVYVLQSYNEEIPKHSTYFNHTLANVKNIGQLELMKNNYMPNNHEQQFTMSLPINEEKYIAFGFIDQGVCMEIHRISVSYYSCEALRTGVTIYKQVFAPLNGFSEHLGSCVENARPLAEGSLKWKCSTSGEALYGDGCTCEDGFQAENTTCVAVKHNDEEPQEGEFTSSVDTGQRQRNKKILLLSTIIPAGVLLLVVSVALSIVLRRRHEKRHQLIFEPVTADMDDETTTYVPESWAFMDNKRLRLTELGDKGSVYSEAPTKANDALKTNNHPVYQNIDHYEFPPENLTVLQVLGEGYFGSVQLAEAYNISGWIGTSNVAVKTLKESSKAQYGEAFLLELDLLRNLAPHQNVVRLLGCCTGNGPARIIFEYMERGDLRSLLKSCCKIALDGGKSSTLPLAELLSFSQMIASGMQHLGENKVSVSENVLKHTKYYMQYTRKLYTYRKKHSPCLSMIVHRDLATRNVLVDHNLVCKVADFGLARRLNEEEIYQKGPEQAKLPIEWMAPESVFKGTYSIKTDVWSFGVVLWEMFSCGDNPYPSYKLQEVLKLLEEKHRMKCPVNCPKEVYQVMLSCWDEEPVNRPPFSQLVEVFASNDLWKNASLLNVKETIIDS